MDTQALQKEWAPRLLSVLRIVSGFIFMLHGTQKHLGFPPSDRVVELFSMSGMAGVIELICGILLLIGFQTRAAAFLASGTMAFAYWLAHAPQSLYPVNNGGDAAILYCFVFLYLVFAGPGPWSLDAMRKGA
ncbi:DoxX family protein [Halomonas ramblicola]|uniref:DoxX family protein n=1 Tax=Halomonas ramblicola TaxID=747349 RepID=UPI0025B48995|nr:DoxX family protein [Halomonas ramblicola]MDN3523337.1 DoxX family protein [Halomonas ramblicola]